MPKLHAVYGLIRKKFEEIGLDPSTYTLGDEYQDDSYALYSDGDFWYVGGNDRGRPNESARFNSPARAAEHLIFLVLKGSPKITFPEIDWTEYASLP